jgi:oxygen-independent coproporphyrinogen-3 oxidase
MQGRYLEALLADLEAHEWTDEPETIYLGGGSPESVEPAALEQILRCIPGRPWREATIEAAPGQLRETFVAAWKELGVNRVSLGVQSFIDRELRVSGRRHTAATVAHDCELLRLHGIDNLNLDLIAGLPYQTLESWGETLDWVERLNPPHVSVYMLEVDEDSRLGREILQGGQRYGAGSVPDEEVVVAMYDAAVARLRAMGLERYEISNFARPGWESLHNLKYWTDQPYFGFGADAHSYDGTWRSRTERNVEDYICHPRRRYVEAADPADKLLAGLRLTRGLPVDAGLVETRRQLLQEFAAQGLLELDNGRLRLTDRGMLFSNEVIRELAWI